MIDRVRYVRLGVVSLTLAASASLVARDQSQTAPLTFRSSADYVQVAVQANDRDGRPIGNLTKADLQLLEDGKLQDIETFAAIDTPIERRQAVHAATFTPAVGETARATNVTATNGRAFVFFVDTMHIAAQRTFQTRQLLKQFIVEKMGDNDIAAVVLTGGLAPSQDFTGDKSALLAAVNRATGDRLPSRVWSKWHHALVLNYDYVKDEYAGERAARASQSMASLRRVVQMLSGLGGRRTAVLYFSEGFDIDMADRIGKVDVPHMNLEIGRTTGDDYYAAQNDTMEALNAGIVADEFQATVEATTRANVKIYTVDPRGLADQDENNIQIVGPVTGQHVGGTANGWLPTAAIRHEVVRTQQFLRDVAGRTGGTAIVNTNGFDAPFDTIMQDSSHYYLLTYRIAHKDDGKFHRIAVRTTRPGVTITARDGYYSLKANANTKATAVSPLSSLLESPIQLPGLAMSAASTVVPTTDGGVVRFAVEFDGAGLQSSGNAPPAIDLAYVVTNDDGKVVAHGEKTLTLAVSNAMRVSLAEHGLRYVGEVKTPAGRHHVRMAARSVSTQATGSLFWDVDVTSVPPSDVAVSPLVLTSEQSDTVPTITEMAPASAAVNGRMTARRTFRSQDVLSISTLVGNGRDASDVMAAAFVITGEDGREIARRDVALPSADRRTEMAAFGQRVALESLTPGRYRADFVVKSANGKVRAERALEFQVQK